MAKLVRLYIPYMGNKFQIKDFIINSLLKRKPKAKYFYDLFGGGGSISIAALQTQRFKKVYYNETQKKIVALMTYLKSLDKVPDEFYEWVSRDKFWEIYESPDENWYKGFVQQIWSFGNKGDSYIYGRDREEWKRLAHEAIVHNDFSALEKLDEDFHIGFKPFEGSFIETRRSEFRKQISDYLRAHKDELEPDLAKRIKQLGDLQHFPRINTLKNLIESGVLKNLEISNGSYEDFDIKTSDEESIIYCFDKETEFLTLDGWKYGKDLTPKDNFYSIDPHNAKYITPLQADCLIKYHYKGEMYKYEDDKVDLLVTPSHRIAQAKPYSFGSKIKLTTAKDFMGKNGYFPTGARKQLSYADTDATPKDIQALALGCWLAKYSNDKNANGRHSLEELLTSEKVYALFDHLDIHLEPSVIPALFADKDTKPQGMRTLVDIMLSSTPYRTAYYMLAGVLISDMAYSEYGKELDFDKPLFNRTHFVTRKSWVRDTIMRMLVILGYSTRCTDMLDGYLIASDKWYSEKDKACESWVDYDDMVYCVRLPMQHTVAVRRNGKVVWCGQCDIPYFSTAKYQGEASGFDHAKYYEWQKKIGKSVFTSEYTMPEEFSLIDSTKKRVLLAAQGAQKTADEKLFWNNLGDVNTAEDPLPAEQLKMEL